VKISSAAGGDDRALDLELAAMTARWIWLVRS
jgi:hypothetical protein